MKIHSKFIDGLLFVIIIASLALTMKVAVEIRNLNPAYNRVELSHR